MEILPARLHLSLYFIYFVILMPGKYKPGIK